MAVNLASKYSGKVDERFKVASKTEPWTSGEYEFLGVQTVKVYNVNTSALNDYDRTAASNRFGTPAELGDSVQEMTLSQDKGFTFIIDAGNDADQMGAKNAGKALRREVDEVIIPTVDKYRLAKWANGAGNGAIISAPAAATIVGLINTACIALDNDGVPEEGRAIFIRATDYGYLRTSTEFAAIDPLGAKSIGAGVVGEVFGVPVIKVPDSYLPDCYFMIVHKSAVFAPTKIQKYTIKKDPPGIDGSLAEGRLYYDAFVKGQKADGIYVAGVSGSMCAAVTATYVGSTTDTITLASATAGTTIKYTLDGTDPKFSTTALTYSSALDTSAWAAGTYTVKAYAEKTGLISSLTSTTAVAVSDS